MVAHHITLFNNGTMESPQNVIAWLVPTALATLAHKAINISENAARTIDVSSSPYLCSRLPDLVNSRPQKVIQLGFDQPPKRPGSFVLGTDTKTCDIVLPPIPGIAPQHCCFRFDNSGRLVLEDFSESGTQVWYDWESQGDKVDHTWLLSSGPIPGFPTNTVQRIVIDIQGVRFQVVVNDHSSDWAAYDGKVEEFCRQANWCDELMTDGLDPAAVPLFKQVFVKGSGTSRLMGEMYLWDLTRPWEPMVKAAA